MSKLRSAIYRLDVSAALRLVEETSDIENRSDDYQETLLSSACRIHPRELDMITRILDKGAAVNACDKDGKTALYYCSNDDELVKLLFSRGALLNTQDNWGNTPLHRACVVWAYGRSEIGYDATRHEPLPGLILAHLGADVTIKNKEGVTPLHAACWWRNTRQIKLLLDAGADPNARDDEGRSVFDIARQRGVDLGRSV